MRALLATLALTFLAAGPAFAHGKGGEHIMGTVKQLQENVLTIEKTDAKEVAVTLNAQTKLERDGAGITAKDLVIGERAVVHAQKDASGALVAQVIKVSKPQVPAKKNAPPQRGPEHKH